MLLDQRHVGGEAREVAAGGEDLLVRGREHDAADGRRPRARPRRPRAARRAPGPRARCASRAGRARSWRFRCPARRRSGASRRPWRRRLPLPGATLPRNAGGLTGKAAPDLAGGEDETTLGKRHARGCGGARRRRACAGARSEPLNAYRVKPTAENKKQLAAAGFDLTEGDHGRYIEIYATRRQARALRADGVDGEAGHATSRPPRIRGLHRRATPPATSGRATTRSPATARSSTSSSTSGSPAEPIVKKVEHRHRRISAATIWALKITKDADTTPDNTRPAVLYNAQQHAREWLAGETCRRTLDFFVDNYGGTGTRSTTTATRSRASRRGGHGARGHARAVVRLHLQPGRLRVHVHRGNRLWRKNMADNDGDGILGEPERRRRPEPQLRDELGPRQRGLVATIPTDETFRGTGPDSEPETQAMKALWDKVDFAFQKNDHTAAELLLYPQGFQQYTPTPDNGIFEALAGDDVDSAIADKAFDEDDRGPGRSRTARSTRTSRQPLRPGHLGRALHHQRRHARRRVPHARHPRLHAGGLRAADDERLGLRVPGRRGGRRGRVPAPPAVRARPARVGGRPGATRSRTCGNDVQDFYVDDVRRTPTATRRRSR